MNIALDYDQTYTADPGLWDNFAWVCHSLRHKVYIVTMRNKETEAIEAPTARGIHGVVYTNRVAKARYMREQNIKIDIWIDDRPEFILNGADNG